MSSSSSRQQQQQPRLSTKEANAAAQRKQMTERRHEMSSKIRKQKRSHLVQVKRRFQLSSSSSTTPTTTAVATYDSPEEAARAFLQRRDEAALQALQTSLGKQQHQLKLSLFRNEEEKAVELANLLSEVLTSPTSTPSARLHSARILTNLAVDHQKQGSEDDDDDDDDNDSMSYYGRVPRGWCSILATSSPAMAALQKGLGSQDLDLAEQCAWAVGNLCGDSFEARQVATTSGMLLPLCTALRIGFERKRVTMCRNVAWALSNLARGIETSALPFLDDFNNKLNYVFLANLMLYPEQQESSREWIEVAHEVCWLVAFLTAREEEAIHALLHLGPVGNNSQQMSSSSPLCEAVACRLDHAAQFIQSSSSSFASDDVLRAIQMALPCLRIIGNIASCSATGQTLPILLEARHRSICKSLATIMTLGTYPSSQSNGDLRAVAVEASWAAGTILCDAGTPNHPSSIIGAPALLPTLCNCLKSQQSPLDLKRQVLQALWNAVAAPPEHVADAWSSRSTRDEYLVQIFQTIPAVMRLLVDLMLNSDMDVVTGSLHLCNAMLRRIGDNNNNSNTQNNNTLSLPVKRTFLEADGLDALERICDRATESSHYYYIPGLVSDASAAADMAADLIDDLFGDETEDADLTATLTPGVVTTTTTTTTTTKGDGGGEMFAFGLLPSNNSGTFHFGPTASVQQPRHHQPLGRGRGQPMVPSWMAQQQHQQQGQHQ